MGKEDILKIEKMKRRVWDQKTKKFQLQFTNNFIITMKGNKIKDRIKIFDRLNIRLRVRPYITSVIQCFNYFKFGHVKTQCKNEAKYTVCSLLHSPCTVNVIKR